MEYSKVRDEYSVGLGYRTISCGNLYSLVIERALRIAADGGLLGMIVPISAFGTNRMESLQTGLISCCSNLWTSHFGIRPSKLFEGAEQRLTIIIGRRAHSAQTNDSFYSTKYHRWYGNERPVLLEKMSYQQLDEDIRKLGYPKISSKIEADILLKMPEQRLGSSFAESASTYVYWHRIPGYFIKAVDFVPYFWSDRDGVKKSEDYKLFGLRDTEDATVVIGIMNSTLFYWYWFSISDGYHCGKHEVLNFPIEIAGISSQTRLVIAQHVRYLMEDYQQRAIRRSRSQRTTNVIYDEFYPSQSKPIIDEIDRVLARHYGVTDEELDYIVNYDIKYRLGADDGEDGE